MESSKTNEKKRFLKSFWWFILLSSIGQVFLDGFIGLIEGFDWNFIYQPKSYLKLIFYIVCWTVGCYLLFWRPNLRARNQEQEIKD
jgi:hypothetical protein